MCVWQAAVCVRQANTGRALLDFVRLAGRECVLRQEMNEFCMIL